MNDPRRNLSRRQDSKHTPQNVVGSGATHAGRITVGARTVRDFEAELGDPATDVFGIGDAAGRTHGGVRDEAVGPG